MLPPSHRDVLPSYPGDEGGGYSCILHPFCSEADKRSLHPKKPRKHDGCLKSCLPTTSYPPKGGEGTSLGFLRLQSQSETQRPLQLTRSRSLMAIAPCHGGTQTVPKQTLPDLVRLHQKGLSNQVPGQEAQKPSGARVQGEDPSVVSWSGGLNSGPS